jgi:hypothetical protein
MSLKSDLDLLLSNLNRDYVKERAAKELPGFIPDFAGLAQLRAPRYEPQGAILQEVQALSQQGYHVSTHELREPPCEVKHGEDWTRCEGIVIENCFVLIT